MGSAPHGTIVRDVTHVRCRFGTSEHRRGPVELAREELRDAQKLQAIAQLSSGTAHLFNNTPTVVRSAAEDVSQTRTPTRSVCLRSA